MPVRLPQLHSVARWNVLSERVVTICGYAAIISIALGEADPPPGEPKILLLQFRRRIYIKLAEQE